MSKLDSLKSLIPAAAAVAAFCAGEKNAEAQAVPAAPDAVSAAASAGFSVPFQTRVPAENFVRWYRDTVTGAVGSTLSGKNQTHLTLQVPKGLSSDPGAGWTVELSCPDPNEYARFVSGGKGAGKASGSAKYMSASAKDLGLGRFKLQGGSSPNAGQILAGAVVCETKGKDEDDSSRPADKHTLTVSVASVDVSSNAPAAVLPAPPVDAGEYSPPAEGSEEGLPMRIELGIGDPYNPNSGEHGISASAGVGFRVPSGPEWWKQGIAGFKYVYGRVTEDVDNTADGSTEELVRNTHRALVEVLWHPAVPFLSTEDVKTHGLLGGNFGVGVMTAGETDRGFTSSGQEQFAGGVRAGLESGIDKVKAGVDLHANFSEGDGVSSLNDRGIGVHVGFDF